jgi:hypothetical protein
MWGALSDERTDLSFTIAAGLASAVILGSESRVTRDHILLSQIREFLFRRLLRLAGLRWRYSTPPPHGLLTLLPQLSFLYPLRTDRVENTVFNSTSIVARRFVAVGTCLLSRCLETALVYLLISRSLQGMLKLESVAFYWWRNGRRHCLVTTHPRRCLDAEYWLLLARSLNFTYFHLMPRRRRKRGGIPPSSQYVFQLRESRGAGKRTHSTTVLLVRLFKYIERTHSTTVLLVRLFKYIEHQKKCIGRDIEPIGVPLRTKNKKFSRQSLPRPHEHLRSWRELI